MSIITLTTDLGQKDFYVPAIKGKIISELNTNVSIIDISHEIPIFDIKHAAFTLKNCYKAFPDNTIHIISIDSEVSHKTKALVAYYENQYFISADNGIFSLLFDLTPEKVYEINVSQDSETFTFPSKNIFVKVACHLARGGTPEIIGTKTADFKQFKDFIATTTSHAIRGQVIYRDSYGNIITNISKRLFEEICRGRPFVVRFKNYEIKRISTSYSDVPEGEKLAIFNSTNNLEIAINRGVPGGGGSASQLLGLNINEVVLIEFEER